VFSASQSAIFGILERKKQCARLSIWVIAHNCTSVVSRKIL
jgi:hypothetical protein